MIDLVVLASGSGSNFQAIVDAIGDGRLDARVRLLLCNKPDAGVLERSAAVGVPTKVIPHRAFASREAFDATLVEAASDLRVAGWVVLAGFMRILGPTFLTAFGGRVINIHPALLPAFPGVDAQAQALARGVTIAGCTVHLVDAGTDTGPILAQAAVPVLAGDDRDALAARILEKEHALLPTVLQWIAEGRLAVVDGRPCWSGIVPSLGLS